MFVRLDFLSQELAQSTFMLFQDYSKSGLESFDSTNLFCLITDFELF
jgi:hypothetical protein